MVWDLGTSLLAYHTAFRVPTTTGTEGAPVAEGLIFAPNTCHMTHILINPVLSSAKSYTLRNAGI